MSAMARAMRPFPSSNGWTVTNQRWARPALSTGSRPVSLLNQARKASISCPIRSAGGAWKWTRSCPDREAEGLHPPDQPPLLVPHRRKRVGEGFRVPPEIRPVFEFADVQWMYIGRPYSA